MGEPVFSSGATATLKDEPSGTPVTLNNIKTISGNDAVIAFGDVTTIDLLKLKKRPNRDDPGTITLTFLLTDDAIATNQMVTLRTKRTNRQKVTLTVNLPGSWDDGSSIISYTGYLSSFGQPEISVSDEALTYTVGLQVTD